MPAHASDELKAIANRLTYGWGVIPVEVRIGGTSWQTSLIPKDGRYLVPVRADIRKAERLAEGDLVAITIQTMA